MGGQSIDGIRLEAHAVEAAIAELEAEQSSQAEADTDAARDASQDVGQDGASWDDAGSWWQQDSWNSAGDSEWKSWDWKDSAEQTTPWQDSETAGHDRNWTAPEN